MTEALVTFTDIPDFSKFGKAVAAKRKDFYAAAMLAVVRDIVKGIKAQMDITGGRLPALEPETIARKGHAAALIDKGLLSDEYTYLRRNKWQKDTGEITIKPLTRVVKTKNGSRRDTPRNHVGRVLQIDGIDTKSGHKKFVFFGIYQDASKTIMELAERIVQESLEAI